MRAFAEQLVYWIEEKNAWDMPSQAVYSPDSARMAYTFGATLYVADARTNEGILGGFSFP